MEWKERDDLLGESKERSKACTEGGLVKGHRGLLYVVEAVLDN